MKLNVKYATKEKKWHSEHIFSYVCKWAEIEAIKIFRRPCGIGSASKRYFYSVSFIPPCDAESFGDSIMIENIDRDKNKHFKPKHLIFVNNVCVLGGENDC